MDLYFNNSKLQLIYKKITRHPDYIFYKAIAIHKKYYKYKKQNNLLKYIYSFKANRISSKYNLELYGKIGDNLRIWHGNVIINGDTTIGNNVQLHGNNCIGKKNNGCPIIGNNVDIGWGAVVLGDITIGNNCIIGANSTVINSFPENTIIAGNPARKIGEKR